MTHHLSVPVLRHRSLKPAYSCIAGVRAYFGSLPRPLRDDELIVVGDRVFTDVVMANRMHRRRAPPSGAGGADEKAIRAGPLAVLTTGVWERESTLMRRMEKGLVDAVRRWVVKDVGESEGVREFVKTAVVVKEDVQRETGWMRRLLGSARA